jgi:hypothetical protein
VGNKKALSQMAHYIIQALCPVHNANKFLSLSTTFTFIVPIYIFYFFFLKRGEGDVMGDEIKIHSLCLATLKFCSNRS